MFSGAIAEVNGAQQSGDTVDVRAADGRFLAWAAYSPASQIRARVWSFEEAEIPGPDLFENRIETALALRRAAVPPEATNALRLVHGESDGLPGLVSDRYADTLVVQVLSAGCERWRDALIAILSERSGGARIHERSDTEGRELEGLSARAGMIAGTAADGPLEIVEHGIRYEVDVAAGQKTGFYLDQRDNRARVGLLAEGREVLNGFSYTGGFTLSALAGGARSVLSIDSSAPALGLAKRNLALNGVEANRAEWLQTDVFGALRTLRTEDRQFDFVVLDPPKFAPTPKDAERAARGYKDINLNALKVLRRGGLLAPFSSPPGALPPLFPEILPRAPPHPSAQLPLLRPLTPPPGPPRRLS